MKYLGMIEELLALEDGLSAWETDFLDSVYLQTHQATKDTLTDKQRAVLEKIWNRRLGTR